MANGAGESYTFDTLLELKTAGLIAASAAESTILDLGGSGQADPARFYADLVVEVTALEIASNDEIYDIVFQLSNDATFSDDTDIWDRASMTLAAAEVQRSDANGDSVIGQYTLGVDNVIAGNRYRYCRIYTVVAGTIATGINYTARLAKRKQ